MVSRDFESGQLVYNRWQHTWWSGVYSVMLTKASIMHKKYLTAYKELVLASMLQYIDKNRNCEDLAMAYVVALKV